MKKVCPIMRTSRAQQALIHRHTNYQSSQEHKSYSWLSPRLVSYTPSQHQNSNHSSRNPKERTVRPLLPRVILIQVIQQCLNAPEDGQEEGEEDQGSEEEDGGVGRPAPPPQQYDPRQQGPPYQQPPPRMPMGVPMHAPQYHNPSNGQPTFHPMMGEGGYGEGYLPH